MKALKKYPVMLVLFVAVAAVFLANAVSPDKERSEMENAYLQQFPKLTLTTLLDSSSRGFTQRFEKYLSDQFILRDGWITAKSVAESLLGKRENNGIFYGEDDYLFGIYRSYDEEQLWDNIGEIKKLKAAYPDADIDTMLIPAAYNILTDKAPQDMGNIDQLAVLGSVNAELDEAGINTFPIRDVLEAHAEKGDQVYYRTDHHWTTLGASSAAAAYLTDVGAQFVMPDEALLNEVENFLGTHYSKSKNYDVVADKIEWYDVPVDSVVVSGEEKGSLYDYSVLDTRDKYAMFLHGNHGLTVIKNNDAPADANILVIKDSYANSFVPFLTQSYKTVTVVDLRSFPMGFTELMNTTEFDRVLFLYSFENLASDENFYRLRY